MAARSLASLSLSFGLVNIPVKLYSATESSSGVRFNMLAPDGSRMRQQYVSEKTGKVVERSEMVKGYEFEKDRFVVFTPDELKALDEEASHSIDIVAFVPEKSVDPVYYDKAYYLAPDKRGGKPYALLREAMLESGRCALARWTNRGKQHVVQVRAVDDGLVLQQLLYSDEVRSLHDLDIEDVKVSKPELQLALQLIDQISQDAYDPTQFKDDEKERVLAAIDRKIAGQQVVAAAHREEPAGGGQVIDLMEALRASIGKRGAAKAAPEPEPDEDDRPAPRSAGAKTTARSSAKADGAADARPARGVARANGGDSGAGSGGARGERGSTSGASNTRGTSQTSGTSGTSGPSRARRANGADASSGPSADAAAADVAATKADRKPPRRAGAKPAPPAEAAPVRARAGRR